MIECLQHEISNSFIVLVGDQLALIRVIYSEQINALICVAFDIRVNIINSINDYTIPLVDGNDPVCFKHPLLF